MDSVIGMKYREAVLQPGGGRSEAESLRAFLGRDLSMEAHFEELALSSPLNKSKT